MTKELEQLLEKAKHYVMNPEEKEAQRRSFAYGNTKLSNPNITRESVARAAWDHLLKPPTNLEQCSAGSCPEPAVSWFPVTFRRPDNKDYVLAIGFCKRHAHKWTNTGLKNVTFISMTREEAVIYNVMMS